MARARARGTQYCAQDDPTGHWFEEKLHQQASGLMCGDGGVAGGDFGAEIAVIGAAARLASLDTAMRT